MITHPFALLLVFIAIVSAVFFSEKTAFGQRFFRYLPVPLWCYFIPTVLSTAGVIPSDSPFYGPMSRTLLPACLTLILVGTNLPLLFRLGPKALVAMASGSVGIGLGGMITFVIMVKFQPLSLFAVQPELLENLWKGWGSLSASWTGGSANMIAVKESIGTPESLFSNLIIVDTIVAYSWMALLVFSSKYQRQINGFLGVQENEANDYGSTIAAVPSDQPDEKNWKSFFAKQLLLLAFGFMVGHLCWRFALYFPEIGKIFNRFTWTILLATAIPLLLSATPVHKLDHIGASKTGTFLLYLLLTSIGAKASLLTLKSAPMFIVLGLVWVIVHGVVLGAAGRLFKIPIALLATASQANVGGTASTPIVAGVYNPGLASLGVVLAILGNIYGTIFGLFFSQVCKFAFDLLK